MSDDITAEPRPSTSSSQIKFIRPAQMSLFARVTSYPPLGEVTCVKRYQKALVSSDDDIVGIPSPFCLYPPRLLFPNEKNR
jgi:hypothetical protein